MGLGYVELFLEHSLEFPKSGLIWVLIVRESHTVWGLYSGSLVFVNPHIVKHPPPPPGIIRRPPQPLHGVRGFPPAIFL